MRQAELGQGLEHQPFTGHRRMRGRQPLAKLIDGGIGVGGNFSRNLLVQTNQPQRHVTALWPRRGLTGQAPAAQDLGHIGHTDKKLLGYRTHAVAAIGQRKHTLPKIL
jgi:hypothetical protein